MLKRIILRWLGPPERSELEEFIRHRVSASINDHLWGNDKVFSKEFEYSLGCLVKKVTTDAVEVIVERERFIDSVIERIKGKQL